MFNEKFNITLNYLLGLDEDFKECFESLKNMLSEKTLIKCAKCEPFANCVNGVESELSLMELANDEHMPWFDGLILHILDDENCIKYYLDLTALNNEKDLRFIHHKEDYQDVRTGLQSKLCSLTCINDEANIETNYDFVIYETNNKYKITMTKRVYTYYRGISEEVVKNFDVNDINELLVDNNVNKNI